MDHLSGHSNASQSHPETPEVESTLSVSTLRAMQGLLAGSLLRVYHHPPVTGSCFPVQHPPPPPPPSGDSSSEEQSRHTPGWSLSAAGALCDVGFACGAASFLFGIDFPRDALDGL